MNHKNQSNPGNEHNKKKIMEFLGMTAAAEETNLNWAQEVELLFTPESIPGKMLYLLKNAELREDFSGMQYLEACYSRFLKEKDVKFTIPELFTEGWLIHCVDEWQFNINMRSGYKKIEKSHSGKESQIICFLEELAKIPYCNTWRINTLNTSSWQELPEGIVKTEDGELCFDIYGIYWEKLGSAIMGKWWSDIARLSDEEIQDKKEQIEKWFCCRRLLHPCWRPECYTDFTRELFEACLERLEKEKKQSTWDQMEYNLKRRLYLEYESVREKGINSVLSDFPDTLIEKVLYLAQRIDLFWVSAPPYEAALDMFYSCTRMYESVGADLRRRFLNCLSIPYLCQELSVQRKNSLLLADCLEEPDLYLVSAYSIWMTLRNKAGKNSYAGVIIVDECSGYLFKILENKLQWSSGKEQWKKVLAELMWFLSEEGPFAIKGGAEPKYMIRIHETCMRWYKKCIVPQNGLNEYVKNYLYNKFLKEEGIKSLYSFIEYVVLAGLSNENGTEESFKIFKILMKRIQQEDFLISQMVWTFWQAPIWHQMMCRITDSDVLTEAFLDLLDPEIYQRCAEIRKGKSPVLCIGKAGLIYICLLTYPLLELHAQINKQRREKFEAAFADCFLGFQIKGCDPFEVESIRLLEAETVIQRCMESISMVSVGTQKRIVSELTKQPVEKILFLVNYIKRQEIKDQLINTVICRTEENFTKTIAFFPTWQQLITQLVDICFQKEDKTLLGKAKELFDNFQEAIHNRGKNVEGKYSSWIETVRIQIMLLSGREQEVLAARDDPAHIFYKALIYLNRGDLSSLKEAETLYETLTGEELPKCSAYINYYITCVRICTHDKVLEKDKITYLQKAEKAAETIWETYTLTPKEKELMCSNELFLYVELNDMPKFWKASEHLTEELKYKVSCAVYLIQMYALGGEKDKAEEYRKDLVLRYGETEQLSQLQRKIEQPGAMGELDSYRFGPLAGLTNEDNEIERLKNALNRMKSLSERECAVVKLQNYGLENPEEANLLEMVADAAEKMGQYSDYLMCETKTASENAYNKFVQILFNQRQKEIWDFYIMDQSQEGSATDLLKNGRQSVGSLDLAVYHNNRQISIIEGIKLNSAAERDIETHIRKIAGYNYADAATVFLLILADSPNPKELWKNYRNVINNMINKTGKYDWHIVKQIQAEEIELIKKRIIQAPLYLCETIHRCDSTGQSFHMYHIMVDIRKKAAKSEAVSSHLIKHTCGR